MHNPVLVTIVQKPSVRYCFHVLSGTWFLGYERHQLKKFFYVSSTNSTILDDSNSILDYENPYEENDGVVYYSHVQISLFIYSFAILRKDLGSF